MPDPVLLFRYSALTFNSHRIHYDRDYATGGEGYPSLVVQGPLTATLLLDLLYGKCLRRPSGSWVSCARDIAGGKPFTVHGSQEGQAVRLWAMDAAGATCMDARVLLGDD
ncbi:MAG: hypothetical protein R3E50_09825 [Halioglobus sp.]